VGMPHEGLSNGTQHEYTSEYIQAEDESLWNNMFDDVDVTVAKIARTITPSLIVSAALKPTKRQLRNITTLSCIPSMLTT
jgi:hypothetical protein